ncbi:hypothetical protein KR026_005603 [Drosophila bipectinata]|nr:hypothetical protein KR026_005603 [Drosophila bipectinata]
MQPHKVPHDLETVHSVHSLPECAKLPLDRIDIISRTIKGPPLEIFDYDEPVSFSTLGEEEELGLSYLESDTASDDKTQGLLMVHDIDCLIRQIEHMQLAIKKRQMEASTGTESEEAKPESEAEEILNKLQRKCRKMEEKRHDLESTPVQSKESKVKQLSCDEQIEARNLRHAHHRLQCEIDEIICQYRKLREVLTQMRGHLCTMEHTLRKLNNKSDELLEWTTQVSTELHVCKERYTHLLSAKISKRESDATGHRHAIRFAKRNDAYLSKNRMKRELTEFKEEVNELVGFMGDLHKELERNLSMFGHKRKISVHDNSTHFLMTIAVAAGLAEMINISTGRHDESDSNII